MSKKKPQRRKHKRTKESSKEWIPSGYEAEHAVISIWFVTAALVAANAVGPKAKEAVENWVDSHFYDDKDTAQVIENKTIFTESDDKTLDLPTEEAVDERQFNPDKGVIVDSEGNIRNQ